MTGRSDRMHRVGPRRAGLAIVAAGLAVIIGPVSEAGAQGSGKVIPYKEVVLQGLDKLTARVQDIVAPVGSVARLGNLEIMVRACQKTPPEDPPEAGAFLEIVEVPPNEQPETLFRGWMFASSPALSALEHPVYDVWVVDCKNPAQ